MSAKVVISWPTTLSGSAAELALHGGELFALAFSPPRGRVTTEDGVSQEDPLLCIPHTRAAGVAFIYTCSRATENRRSVSRETAGVMYDVHVQAGISRSDVNEDESFLRGERDAVTH